MVGTVPIPAEAYKYSPVCNKLLIELLQKIWRTEDVPHDFAKASFVMLFKNKGSSNNPAKYHCIGLLNHSYKVLSQCENLRAKTILSNSV